jgi:hypothetical protein
LILVHTLSIVMVIPITKVNHGLFKFYYVLVLHKRQHLHISTNYFNIPNMSREKLGYMHHIDIYTTFCNPNECAMSQRYAFMIHAWPFPKLFYHPTFVTLWLWNLVGALCKTLMLPLITMLPSVLVLFLTKLLR